MNPFDPGERTEPVPQLAPMELDAQEVRLRPWPVRLGPLAFDRLRDFEDQRRRLDEEWARLDEAREQARLEGLRLGREEALAQNTRQILAQLAHHDDALEDLKRDLIQRLPRLASRLAARALGQELASSPALLGSWVLRLLKECWLSESVTLLHPPGEADRFQTIAQRAATHYHHVRLQLREDERVAPGEFILETPGLRVDARACALSAMWERELEQVLHEPEPG